MVLKIIARFSPAVFVMENVKGILSSTHKGTNIFQQILKDLKRPSGTSEGKPDGEPEYDIHSLTIQKTGPLFLEWMDYLLKAEDYGIPQMRHRIILLGVRRDIKRKPEILIKRERTSVAQVISDLPPIRSMLSREPDSMTAWREVLRSALNQGWYSDLSSMSEKGEYLKKQIRRAIEGILPTLSYGKEFYTDWQSKPDAHAEWFVNERLDGVCNHSARAHMREDLIRYLFLACFAEIQGKSPFIRDFPDALLPDHKNVNKAVTDFEISL